MASRKPGGSPSFHHLKNTGYKPVGLSLYLLRYWHNRLNAELFGNELTRIRLTYGDSSAVVEEPVCGYYLADPDGALIHIDSRCSTRARFLNTLAHEMVHQLQHERGLPLTHGQFFKAQAKRLAQQGLII